MGTSTSIITAAAALLAAALSAANLLISRHHARTQWLRDALVPELSAFLAGAFDCIDAVRDALERARLDVAGRVVPSNLL
jgi:hypothetical protein